MAKRLWDKGGKLDSEVQQFSVGNDPELDLKIIEHDILASIAHAQMLEKISVISTQELSSIHSALKTLSAKVDNKDFSIDFELEDGHTAIESYLTETIGTPGLKVHSGRSRNDQVLVATRLYLRTQIVETLSLLLAGTKVFLDKAEEYKGTAMPGYTHMQPAMPSSISMWTHAFAESLLELIADGLRLLDSINSNPLGVASGFGVPIALDRELTAKLLGFDSVQRNPINVQNSRGKHELKFLRFASDSAAVFEKFACDMLIYTTKEFGFFELPPEITTGSSIMPQKRNPDVLELLRGSTAKIRAAEDEMRWVIAKLPSNYHRDFQYTKEPLIRGAENLRAILLIASKVVSSFKVNKEKLKTAMCDELYSTYEVYRKLAQGNTFRDAYREVGKQLEENKFDRKDLEKDFEPIEKVLNQEIGLAKKEFAKLEQSVALWSSKLAQVKTQLLK
jgi:argininosuccinate lyase